MNELLQAALSNAVMVVPLALLAAGVSLFKPRPAVVHVLWLIVLAKLVTPPLVAFPMPHWDLLVASRDRAGAVPPSLEQPIDVTSGTRAELNSPQVAANRPITSGSDSGALVSPAAETVNKNPDLQSDDPRPRADSRVAMTPRQERELTNHASDASPIVAKQAAEQLRVEVWLITELSR